MFHLFQTKTYYVFIILLKLGQLYIMESCCELFKKYTHADTHTPPTPTPSSTYHLRKQQHRHHYHLINTQPS